MFPDVRLKLGPLSAAGSEVCCTSLHAVGQRRTLYLDSGGFLTPWEKQSPRVTQMLDPYCMPDYPHRAYPLLLWKGAFPFWFTYLSEKGHTAYESVANQREVYPILAVSTSSHCMMSFPNFCELALLKLVSMEESNLNS